MRARAKRRQRRRLRVRTMSPRARRRIVCLTAALLVPSRALADPKLVAVGTDARLSHAIEVAVASWHVRVVPKEGPPPPEQDMTSAIRAAHRIARESDAQAVMWLELGGGSASLWMYDVRTHQISVRPLSSAPPYDDATSASVALTVKTLLQVVLEPHEPSKLEEAPEDATPPPFTQPAASHAVRLMTFAALHLPTHAADRAAYRVGLELAYFPAWFHGRLGIAATVEGGPSVFVERAPLFSGTFSDTTLTFGLRGRVPLRRWISVEAGAGMGLHLSTIEGSSFSGDLSGRLGRVDASLESLLGLQGAWRALRVGPFAGASYLLHYQRYRVGDVPILDVPTIQLTAGLRVGVELP